MAGDSDRTIMGALIYVFKDEEASKRKKKKKKWHDGKYNGALDMPALDRRAASDTTPDRRAALRLILIMVYVAPPPESGSNCSRAPLLRK